MLQTLAHTGAPAGLFSDHADTDPDATDTLTVSAVNGAAGNVATAVGGSYGSVTIGINGAYTYTLNNGNASVQALGVNDTLSDSFSYTVTDSHGGTSTATLTITIFGTNDNHAPTVLDSHTWMPSDPAQEVPGYSPNGYPLLVNIPTDVDGDNLHVIATGTVPAGTFYFNGVTYVAVTSGMTLYDPSLSINLLDDLVYRPTSTVTDTVNVALTLDVYDGTVHATEIVNIHELPPTSIAGPVGGIAGDSGHPLTSGSNAQASFTLSTAFADAIDNDSSAGSITLTTDFQNRPGYSIPIQSGDRNGDSLEAQVNVYIFVDGIKFQAVSTTDGNPNTWLFDGNLMKTVVDFDNINNTTVAGQTLAQYIALHPVAAGESWTIQYDDITPGNEQARMLNFSLQVFDPGNPSITVSGNTTLPDLIYGGSGSDILSGNGGDDIIIGRGGNDIITGGVGSDTLTGGSGADHFRYNATIDGGATGDHIVDFSHAEGDTIDLLLSAFSTLSGVAGTSVSASDFSVQTSAFNAANEDIGTAHLSYYQGTSAADPGKLYYDSDGGGSANRVLLAILDNHAAITANDVHKV